MNKEHAELVESLRTISITHAHLSFVAHAASAIERLSKDSERLAEFAREVIKSMCWDFPSSLDGCEVQDLAAKLGLIEERVATAEDIDQYSLEETEVGETFFEFTPIIARTALQLYKGE